jgi:hypothetical protein
MLDLKKHCHESQDGRHWSSPEMADFMDGKISVQQMCMIAKARWERESQFFVPKGTMPV